MVWTNPEPHDIVFHQYAEGAIVIAHAYRVHRAPLTNSLEFQAGVPRI